MPSWRCSLCRVDNDSAVAACCACETLRVPTTPASNVPTFTGLSQATGTAFATALGGTPSTTDGHRFTFGFGSEATAPTASAVCKSNEGGSEDDDLEIYGMAGDEVNEILKKVSPSQQHFGKIFTWGASECDQLAISETLCDDMGYCPMPRIVKEIENEKTISVACGALHTIALSSNGDIWSWGCNDDGALGRVLSEDESERYPGRVNLSTKIRSISCGDSHSAAISENGELYIWGSYKDGSGHIGAPNFDDHELIPSKVPTPVKVEGLEGRVLQLACGDNHTVVLVEGTDSSLSVSAWGSNEFGQMGQPQVETTERPVGFLFPHTITLPNGINRVLAIFASGAATFLSVESDDKTRKVFACGRNGRHELGVDSGSDVCVPKLVEVEALRGLEITMIAGGQFSAAALTSSGEVFSWGRGSVAGQGRVFVKDARLDVLAPTKVSGLSDICFVGAGADTTFAISKDGLLFAWGDGSMYQLGNGEDDDKPVGRPLVVRPSLFEGAAVLAAVGGSSHSVALVYGGDLPAKRRRRAADEVAVIPKKRQRRGVAQTSSDPSDAAPEGTTNATVPLARPTRRKAVEVIDIIDDVPTTTAPQPKRKAVAQSNAGGREKRTRPEAAGPRRVSPRLVELEAKRHAEEKSVGKARKPVTGEKKKSNSNNKSKRQVKG